MLPLAAYRKCEVVWYEIEEADRPIGRFDASVVPAVAAERGSPRHLFWGKPPSRPSDSAGGPRPGPGDHGAPGPPGPGRRGRGRGRGRRSAGAAPSASACASALAEPAQPLIPIEDAPPDDVANDILLDEQREWDDDAPAPLHDDDCLELLGEDMVDALDRLVASYDDREAQTAAQPPVPTPPAAADTQPSVPPEACIKTGDYRADGRGPL